MERVKAKVKELVYDKELYIFAGISLLFFGVFCLMQYAPDTYSVFTNDLKHTVVHFLSCGRFVTAIATYFSMGIMHLGKEGTYLLSYGFAIICTTISLYRLNKLVKKDIKNNSMAIIVSTLIIINPFSIELFMYIEKGIMLLSVLLCVLAVEQIDRFFEGNRKSILFALLFMFLANCCYQGTVGLFVAIALIDIIKYSKNVKQFIINNIIVALTYGIPAVINFLSVRFIFTNARVKGNMILIESLSKVLAGTQRMLVDTYDLLPHYLFLIMIIFLLSVIIYKGIKERKVFVILGAFYIMGGTLFATVAPQIMQDTNAIWFVARSSYPMAAILGILIWYIGRKTSFYPLEKTIIVTVMILFLMIQFTNFMSYTIDNYIGNYMDKTITLEINELIEDYEEKSGNTIEYVAVYSDAMMQYVYPGLKASGDMNIKAYSANWCISRILKLYTGREIQLVESDPSKKETFSQKNWDYFNKEQVIFEDNVMHLCVF